MAKEQIKASGQNKAAGEGEQSAATNEQQLHVVTREVIHDGDVYAAGDDIALTRKQHAQLHAVGAVAEGWRD